MCFVRVYTACSPTEVSNGKVCDLTRSARYTFVLVGASVCCPCGTSVLIGVVLLHAGAGLDTCKLNCDERLEFLLCERPELCLLSSDDKVGIVSVVLVQFVSQYDQWWYLVCNL